MPLKLVCVSPTPGSAFLCVVTLFTVSPILLGNMASGRSRLTVFTHHVIGKASVLKDWDFWLNTQGLRKVGKVRRELNPSMTTWSMRYVGPQRKQSISWSDKEDRPVRWNQLSDGHDILTGSTLPFCWSSVLSHSPHSEITISYPAGLHQLTQSSQQIPLLLGYSRIPWPSSDLEIYVNHWHFNAIFFSLRTASQ